MNLLTSRFRIKIEGWSNGKGEKCMVFKPFNASYKLVNNSSSDTLLA